MYTGRYILIPRVGVRGGESAKQALRSIFDQSKAAAFGHEFGFNALGEARMAVLDSTNEDGSKLVVADRATADAVNAAPGPLRMIPEVIYELPTTPMIVVPAATPATATVTITCVNSVNGTPIAGITIYAYTDFARKVGARGVTNASGQATLALSGTQIEQLWAFPEAGWWGASRGGIPIASQTLPIDPVTASTIDVIRATYPTRRFNPATGVTVGVLDSGCGPHTELNVVSGRCTVTGQPANAFQDIGEHGTHVAGLIGGKGTSGPAVNGLAPGVKIRAYRVFEYGADGKLGASNYAILKAMIFAANDGCDIVNLSLGGGPFDYIVEEAIRDAGEQGMLTVVAAGNDDRSAVNYPAAYNGAFAVSAMGNELNLPAGCYDRSAVMRPPASSISTTEFLADFSNVGVQISAVGLGVGVTSTLPGNRLGIMSGTSMAAPMIAGCAAAMLSNNPAIFGQVRSVARANALGRMVTLNCIPRFGNALFEGFGLPNPASV